jgi:hypothetical protein
LAISDTAPAQLAKYGLSDWPFREVPEPSRCTFLAGRPELAKALDRLLHRTNPVSSIHLFWASLGAGNTHALYYLMNRMRLADRFLPVYTEYPEAQADFLGIYQLLAQRIPWDGVAESCFQLFTDPDPSLAASLSDTRSVHPNIYRAFFLLAEGKDDRRKARLAHRWLRGEPLSRGDLSEAGLAQSLSSPSECAAAISILTRVLGLRSKVLDPGSNAFRLVWIVDECQRLGRAPLRMNHEVNAGFQSTFNSTPDHFSLILSFSGMPEPELPKWLRPELADRIGIRNLFLLPPFDRDHAKQFLRELLAHFRVGGAVHSPFHPFTESAVDFMIARVVKGKLALIEGFTESDGVRPRALVKVAHAVLEEHSELGGQVPIDDRFVAQVFPK